MKIDRIRLLNFRCFEDAIFDFPGQFTVLIGENGTGKSALMQALRVAAGTFLLELNEAYGENISKSDVRLQEESGTLVPKWPTEIQAWGNIKGLQFSWRRSKLTLKGQTTRKDAKQLIEYATQLEADLNTRKSEVEFPIIAFFSTARLWVGERGQIPLREEVSKIRDGYDECLDEWRDKHPALDWIKTNFLLKKKADADTRTRLDAVLEAIALCVPGWSELRWDDEADDLVGQYQHSTGLISLMPLQYLSDGLRIVAGMAAEIAYRCAVLNGHLGVEAIKSSEGVILIDELDMHLHPNWQRRIVLDLKQAFPRLQFIATTHSPFIVQSLSSGELINLNYSSDLSPKSLRLEEVASSIMCVESAYGIENSRAESLTQEFVNELSREEPILLDDSRLQQIINKVSDPGLRALLQMQHLLREYTK